MPSAAPSQLSSVYPLGSRLDERGRLQLGGCDALELAKEFGTPAYVVSEDDLRYRARQLVEAFGPGNEVYFASKAFPCTAVYRVLAEEGVGCDVASGGELALALRGGFAPERIELHGNAKTEAELRFALDSGVGTIVLDNLDEIARLTKLLDELGRTQRVMLRIAPGVSPDTHPSISTGGPNTKFGFNLDDAVRALELTQGSDRFDVHGLHFHIGSQIMALDPFREALQRTVDALGTDFPAFNLGGGLGAAYSARDQPPTVEQYAAAKVAMVRELCGPGKVVVDEPGRSLTANACVTLYTVQSVKTNVATWVGIDGGMSDNLRPMLYGAHYECEVADRFGGDTACHVTGKHCESGDVVVRDARLADPKAGDVLVTPATGAYGFSMANTYNGQPRPPVVFVSDGDARLVVRRETYEDLFSRDV